MSDGGGDERVRFERVSQDVEPGSRPRTVSRMRFVAPPGMELDGGEGRQTIGRYEIVKMLGKGAMGIVYKARDPLLDRTVAVKTIVSPQGSGKRIRSAYLERFQREAKAAAKMQHPAIVTIFDVGVDEPSGAPFMVLEYLPGETLADRLDRVRMPLGRGVNIALDLASALAFAHRQRIVHRDVKPANVLHAGEQRWKLADFGIARLPDSDLTQVGIFMGTPGYSPPEAIREGRYTAQADVFAWGAVLYEILCGRIPYEGPDTKTTNAFVVKGDAPPPTRHDASVPEPLAEICLQALEPAAARRFKDAAEAEAALRRAWETCLRDGLVTPMALAGDELPHERVGKTMHAAVTAPAASTRTERPGATTTPLAPATAGRGTADLLPARRGRGARRRDRSGADHGAARRRRHRSSCSRWRRAASATTIRPGDPAGRPPRRRRRAAHRQGAARPSRARPARPPGADRGGKAARRRRPAPRRGRARRRRRRGRRGSS
ncbi:MAG: serine/threonine protein kinase [Kofleriaceae bacterium]|nr:serine/threonine protein kinase [Kofleriaceae bacterium]